jgi:translation initiation factor 2 alpha subunit (eIF-2alpha)
MKEFKEAIIDERHILETHNYSEDQLDNIINDIRSNLKYEVVR